MKHTKIQRHHIRNKVDIIGHKHPDTDSVCSALAYAWLKNQDGDTEHEARCAGSINRETAFVLGYWGIDPPRLCTDVRPQIKDVEFRLQPGISPDMSVQDTWALMRDEEIDTLCVIDEEHNLTGLIALKDIAKASMDLFDTNTLSSAHTPYSNILSTLDGTMLCGDPSGTQIQGRICVGTSPKMMEYGIQPGDIVLTTNLYDTQRCAIEHGASCIILCCGAHLHQSLYHRARKNGCTIILTPLDTYVAARRLNTAVPVRYLMKTNNIIKFDLDTPLEDVRKIMAEVRFRYFPILNENGKYCGVISRRNILNLHRKQLILVDHNEKSQAVDGLEDANILEIIDHHRLGALETDAPVIFRNLPVGCTATILYHIFKEQNVIPPREIAGLMLSAILSDTLMFRSPTSTDADTAAAQILAELAGVTIPEYAEMMFEAGSNLNGRSAEDILFADFKVFRFGEFTFGVGQSCFMTAKSCTVAEQLIVPYLATALAKAQVPILFYMLTNTPKQTTRLLFYGKGASEIVNKAFGRVSSEYYVDLPDVVSRKKQLIPPLRTAVQAM